MTRSGNNSVLKLTNPVFTHKQENCRDMALLIIVTEFRKSKRELCEITNSQGARGVSLSSGDPAAFTRNKEELRK